MQAYNLDIPRPTSPPPPRKAYGGSAYSNESNHEKIQRLTAQLTETQDRANRLQQEALLLNGKIYSLTERLQRHECDDCGETVIHSRYHDGSHSGVPECEFKECTTCGNQWGHN